jgi:allantoinase
MIWGLRTKRILYPDRVEAGVVLIQGETILDVVSHAPPDIDIVDVGSNVVMPGLVDTHVHINEPGRTEWEGFFTATQAALAGGITTVVDMPLNCTPVTTSAGALQIKKQALGDQLFVDIGFWGGVIPNNDRELTGLMAEGAMGCKAFLIHSGIDDFPASDRETLKKAMLELKALNVPLLAHAELDLGADVTNSDPTHYHSYLESRPQQWEVSAIELLIALSRETGCAVHIVHLSAADALPLIQRAKADGVLITAETCPHYLCLCAEEIQNKKTLFKCAPPIRESENRERLWAGLKNGIIDFIVSDHSPCTPSLKKIDSGDFHDAWGGIASLQLGLPAIWTEAKKRNIPMTQLVEWLSRRPAKLAGLSHRKGQIEPGYDADLLVWSPEDNFVLEPKDLRFRHKLSPYLGRYFEGRVQHVYLRGQAVYKNGVIMGAPSGKTVFRGDNE